MEVISANRLEVADCVEFMARMPAECVDLTVTSPPYDAMRTYRGFTFNFPAVAAALYRVTKDGGVVVWVVGDQIVDGSLTLTSCRQALGFREVGFAVHDMMVYAKANTPFTRSNGYRRAWEHMIVLAKGRPKTFNALKVPTVKRGGGPVRNRNVDGGFRERKWIERGAECPRTNVWEYAIGFGGATASRVAYEHPAIFPERLAEDHVLSWSNPGDLVFDPMVGSGTTAKAAAVNGRRYLGVDISPDYITIARERLNGLLAVDARNGTP